MMYAMSGIQYMMHSFKENGQSGESHPRHDSFLERKWPIRIDTTMLDGGNIQMSRFLI
jgi:hypothetical protein